MSERRSAEQKLAEFYFEVERRAVHSTADGKKFLRLLRAVKIECAERVKSEWEARTFPMSLADIYAAILRKGQSRG